MTVLARPGLPSQTLRKASPWAVVSNPGCASGGNGATKCGARSSRRVCGRAFGRELVCSTRPIPARSDSFALSVARSFAGHYVALTSVPDPGRVGLISALVYDQPFRLPSLDHAAGKLALSCRSHNPVSQKIKSLSDMNNPRFLRIQSHAQQFQYSSRSCQRSSHLTRWDNSVSSFSWSTDPKKSFRFLSTMHSRPLAIFFHTLRMASLVDRPRRYPKLASSNNGSKVDVGE